MLCIVILLLGILFIFSSYAWFSTALNVKIKEFNMVVAKNGGLTISFDAINFDSSVELSREILIEEVAKTYPNHLNQWATNGLTPVSSNGISEENSYFFDIFATSGVKYKNRRKENGFIYATKVVDTKPRNFNNYIAFDVFFKNEKGDLICLDSI